MASSQHDTGPLELTAVGRPHPGKLMTEDEFLAPASIVHNRIAGFIRTLLQLDVEERELGEALGIEVSVRIDSKRRRLPDVLFVGCDRLDRLHENHFDGPPNLIVEVVSPESVERDWRVKYLEYEAAGLKEYWIIDPLYQRLEAYALGDDKKYHSLAPVEGKLASRLLAGFYLRSEWLWRERPPKKRVVLDELLAQSGP